MKITTYIRDLISEHDCVILPELGAFVAANASAKVHLIENSFVPPRREVKFNSQLKSNDDMLVNYMASKESITIDEAQFRVGLFIQNISANLNRGDEVNLPDLGCLQKSAQGHITFTAHLEHMDDESFGLDEFISPAIIRELKLPGILGTVTDPKANSDQHADPFSLDEVERIDSRKRYRLWKSYFFRVASVALIFIMVAGLLAFTPFGRQSSQASLASVFAFDSQFPAPLIEMSKRVAALPEEPETSTLNPVTSSSLSVLDSGPAINPQGEHMQYFYLIAGSFSKEHNALLLQKQLVSKGYNALITQEDKNSPFRVCYGHIKGKFKALEMLTKIRSQENPDAWMLTD